MTPKTASNKKWEASNRDKYLAHKAVENALVAGRISRAPCERCGTLEHVHAHHDDYAQRLDVIWLCPVHHKQRHKELNALGGPIRAAVSGRGSRGLWKLTIEQLAEILHGTASNAELARRFGLCPEGIRYHRLKQRNG